MREDEKTGLRTEEINPADRVDRGTLQILVNTRLQNRPVADARVSISYTGDPERIIEELRTDSSGRTPEMELPTPPLEYSMEPGMNQPYSEYTLQITAPGFAPVEVSGSELLPGQFSRQPVLLDPLTPEEQYEDIVIPEHTLYGEYPEKIPEDEIKPTNETGEIVLSRVVVPEYVVVHDGVPSDSTARDYYVRYRDYIKNVASSEIYATWPTATIEANVLAIMSFTLNRVYTEWYRNRGYDFTITSSTAYDQKWIYGRNIYESISYVVDEIFADYLSRPNVKQPILTQYCDGQRVSCPNWLSQWGSKNLGDRGYSAVQIVRYYYGQDMYINTAEEISGIPASWPGYNLDIGASGDKVRQLQEQLNAIAEVYSAIPAVSVDGIYGEQTKESVRRFQSVFGLPATGVVDYPTWYKVQEIYVAVTRIAELR
ncbi:MAG TPA: peptidoglycan-binding protein [Candidatus Scatomonas merdavium]|nr:peptidoglycan-binding protein [Candidatus Scatomonas merdavium]